MPSSSTLLDVSFYTFEASGFLPHMQKNSMSLTMSGVDPRWSLSALANRPTSTCSMCEYSPISSSWKSCSIRRHASSKVLRMCLTALIITPNFRKRASVAWLDTYVLNERFIFSRT